MSHAAPAPPTVGQNNQPPPAQTSDSPQLTTTSPPNNTGSTPISTGPPLSGTVGPVTTSSATQPSTTTTPATTSVATQPSGSTSSVPTPASAQTAPVSSGSESHAPVTSAPATATPATTAPTAPTVTAPTPTPAGGSVAPPNALRRKSFWKSIRDRVSGIRIHRGTNPPVPKEWISIWLRLPVLISLFLLTIGALAAIVGLVIISNQRNGIAQVSNRAIPIANYKVGPGLAWTTLPVFLFSLYNLAFKAVIAALSDRQPYVELWDRGDGAPVKQSILLDYRVCPIFLKPWLAMRRKHPLLVVGFFFSAIDLLLASLAAHLFEATAVATSGLSIVTQNTSSNQAGFTYKTDLVPVFDLVLATLVYGGIYPDWTTSKYSFQNFSTPAIPPAAIQSSNFSALTMAYSAELDCSILNESQYSVAPFTGGWNFTAVDRGCPLSYLPIFIATDFSKHFTYYIQSFAQIDCDLDVGESRLVLVAAANFNLSLTTLTNFTAVSCKTAYYNSSGILNVNFDPTRSFNPLIQNFTTHTTSLITNPRPLYWKTFEKELHESTVIDPVTVVSATYFGSLVLSYARIIDPQNFFSPGVLRYATEAAFTAIYAIMSRNNLVQPAPAVDLTGTLHVLTTRLLVVAPTAYAIIGMLSATSLILASIYLYVKTHKSTLYEEPQGLAGSAALLCDSVLIEEVGSIRSQSTTGRICESIEKGQHLPDTGWKVERWGDPRVSRIIQTPSVRAPKWVDLFRRNF